MLPRASEPQPFFARRSLVLAGVTSLAGCAQLPFGKLRRNLQDLEQLTAVHGTVSTESGGVPAGPVSVVALARQDGTWRVANHTAIKDGRFVLRLVAGTPVRVVACSAPEAGMAFRQGEACAVSDLFSPAPGRSTHALRLQLSRTAAAGLDAEWRVALRDLPEQRARTLPVAMGQLAALDDPMFDASVSALGMWAPVDFLSSVGGGVYMLQDFRPDRVPVVLVHGAAGSPRDFEALAAALNRQHVQPWVFHYPSGLRQDSAASMLEGILVDIADRLPLPSVSVVAHSMGGLVAMAAVQRLATSARRLRIPSLVTISSPWGGHGAAAWGVRFAPATVPSWLDMQVGSDFQQRLQRTPLADGTAHHLHFSYKGSGDDGTVSLASQLSYSIQARATRVRGHDEDHMSVLSSRDVIAAVRQVVERTS